MAPLIRYLKIQRLYSFKYFVGSLRLFEIQVCEVMQNWALIVFCIV